MEVESCEPINVSGLPVGEYVFKLIAIDNAGNFSTVIVTFYVDEPLPDITAPVITIDSPQEAKTYYWCEELIIIYSTYDPEPCPSGIKEVQATLDDNPVNYGDVIKVIDLAIGEHTFTVTATDNADNISEKTITFYVDVTFDSTIQAITNLFNQGHITDWDVAQGLIDKLVAAWAADEREDYTPAINILENAFFNQLNAQRNKAIDEYAYNHLYQCGYTLLLQKKAHNGRTAQRV